MSHFALAHSEDLVRGIPPQLYEGHALAVTLRALRNVQDLKPYMSEESYNVLLNVVMAASPYHDLGKLCPYCQKVLRGEKKFVKMPNHTDAGTAYLYKLGHVVAAAIVKAHHLGFDDFNPLKIRDVNEIRIRCGWVIDEYEKKNPNLTQKELTDRLLEKMIKVHQSLLNLTLPEKKIVWAEPNLWRMALSCLVEADHHDTSVNYQSPIIEEMAELHSDKRLEKLDALVKEWQVTKCKDSDGKEAVIRHLLKNDIYTACRYCPSRSPFTYCAAEVGTGKTTAMMAYALSRNPRLIIYVTGYTAIISQNVDVYRQLSLPNEKPWMIVAEHHHQVDYYREDYAETILKKAFKNEADIPKMEQDTPKIRKLYTTNWECPIVCTTAVQFAETLCSCRPARLKKLKNIRGAHIIIDESHNCIPLALWPLFLRQLTFLVEEMGCSVTFGSGSMVRVWDIPDIRQSSGFKYEVESLLPEELSQKTLEQEKNRVKISYNPRNWTLEPFCEWIESFKGSRLVVCNTIKNAALVAWRLKKRNQDKILVIQHLSTCLAPEDRENILKEIREFLDKTPDGDIIVVGTSCLEIGLDLSFHYGFRELASLASVRQFAGRVRRKYEADWQDATVFVFELFVDENNLDDPLGFTKNKELEMGSMIFASLEAFDRTGPEWCHEAIVQEVNNLGLSITINNAPVSADNIIAAEDGLRFNQVKEWFRVINENKFTAIVDKDLQERGIKLTKDLKDKKITPDKAWISKTEIVRKSVQIYLDKINKVPVRPAPSGGVLDGFYFWTGSYSKFLGWMAEFLPSI